MHQQAAEKVGCQRPVQTTSSNPSRYQIDHSDPPWMPLEQERGRTLDLPSSSQAQAHPPASQQTTSQHCPTRYVYLAATVHDAQIPTELALPLFAQALTI